MNDQSLLKADGEDAAIAGVGDFLESVIGQGQGLQASGGKLREIHARIGKQVNDTKAELHATVQGQWPDLSRQLTATVNLSHRIRHVKSDANQLLVELNDGDDAIKPRLIARIAAYNELSRRQGSSQAFISLLESLVNIQNNLDQVHELLDRGELENVTPKLQHIEQLLEKETQDWMKDHSSYIMMQEQYFHLRAQAQDSLEAALSRCLAYNVSHSTPSIKISSYTSSESGSSPHTLSLQAILKALSSLNLLQQHLSNTTEVLLKHFIQPTLAQNATGKRLTMHKDPEEAAATLMLETTTTTSDISTVLSSIRELLNFLREYLFPADSAMKDASSQFWASLIPEIQSSVVDSVLVPSIPSNASHSALSAFAAVCDQIAVLEADHLLDQYSGEATLQHWTRNAGVHWCSHIAERCFAGLRSLVISHDYWNKTREVDWLAAEVTSSLRVQTTVDYPAHMKGHNEEQPSLPQPKAEEGGLRGLGLAGNGHESPVEAEVIESDAWNLENVESVSTTASPTHGAQDAAPLSPGSNSVASDDAWGLDTESEKGEPASQPVASTSQLPAVADSAASPASASDGWGFGDDGDQTISEDSSGKYLAHDMSGNASKKSDRSDPDDDGGGWAFEDEVPPSPTKPTSEDAGRIPEVIAPVAKAEVADDWDSWSRQPSSVNPEASPSVSALRPSSPSVQAPAQIRAQSRPFKAGKLGALRQADFEKQEQQRLREAQLREEEARSATPTPQWPNRQGITPSIQQLPVQPDTVKVAEKMLVSDRLHSLLSLSSELLDAALSVSAVEYHSSIYASTPSQLMRAFIEFFDLYRAIMPPAHSALIDTVPSIGVQFSNDCQYLATKGSEQVASRPTQDWSRDMVARMRHTFKGLVKYGDLLLEGQIALQRVPLMEALDETDGLRNTDDPPTFALCQRAIRQVVATLQSIGQAWRPVLRKSVYFESIGILVNAVLLRILVDIENQEDISEEASHRLDDLCKMMYELETLFTDDHESTVAHHVPVWFKFRFLSELLDASMVDIMYLWNEGHLTDFSSTELSKLIIALFADSQLRQQNLEKIAQGR